MNRQVIATSLAPDCIIENVQGNLRVKGWDLAQIAVQADPAVLAMDAEEDTIHLSCAGDCEVRLPHGTALKIGTVAGDLQIKLLDDRLEIGLVQGALSLRNVAEAVIERVGGDLSAKVIAGDLTVQQVMGDASVASVEGDCRLPVVHGDLNLKDGRGSLLLDAKGDLHLSLSRMEGETYDLRAGGDVHCNLPSQVGMILRLESRGRSIQVDLPGHQRRYDQEQVEIRLGSEAVDLSISAGGDILLGGATANWETGAPFMADFSEQISRQVESQIGQQMEEVSRRVQEQMAHLSENLARSGFSPEDTERIVDQAMRLGERETARAQERIRRAQEKLERKLEEAQRKMEQKTRTADRSAWGRPRHTWGRGFPVPPQPPPATDAVSEEERLMILRMLEQKKISLEEADQLLTALEGKE